MIGQALELRRLLNNCRLSPAKLEALRNRKLRATIRHEYENVPYYRSPFQTVGLRPEEIRNVNNLQRLSITRKDDLKAQVWDTSLRRGGDLAACQMVCTSGTTGKPFAIHLTPTDLRARRLVEFWVLLLIGFRPQGRLAVLGPVQPHSMRSYQRLGFYRRIHISPPIFWVIKSICVNVTGPRSFGPTRQFLKPSCPECIIDWRPLRARGSLSLQQK